MFGFVVRKWCILLLAPKLVTVSIRFIYVLSISFFSFIFKKNKKNKKRKKKKKIEKSKIRFSFLYIVWRQGKGIEQRSLTLYYVFPLGYNLVDCSGFMVRWSWICGIITPTHIVHICSPSWTLLSLFPKLYPTLPFHLAPLQAYYKDLLIGMFVLWLNENRFLLLSSYPMLHHIFIFYKVCGDD